MSARNTAEMRDDHAELTQDLVLRVSLIRTSRNPLQSVGDPTITSNQ